MTDLDDDYDEIYESERLADLHAIEAQERFRHERRIAHRYVEHSKEHPLDLERWFTRLPAQQQRFMQSKTVTWAQSDWDRFAAEQEAHHESG